MKLPRWLVVGMLVFSAISIVAGGLYCWCVISEKLQGDRAIQIAKDRAKDEGIHLDEYREPSTYRSPHGGMWVVIFKAKSPTNAALILVVDNEKGDAFIAPPGS